ncbi:hypothetical protein SAMN05216262_11256 [Colwellia chukchiensis]|uniref:DUF1285 domain-containing protein n=1 Tax=Colwellia chukchiensis TaxID=641665 RepID=A0A1H7QQF4_9GAMM|nr:DUF1285 domain-containing protein [Colwellia chukchiensis]SEL49835.1 hypothetical protein SAMN05216262_11256 [Colwellia chukchiensis]
MPLDKISAQISANLASAEQKMPPVDQWHPPYSGEIDIVIKADGHWFYQGGIFKRKSLVKLFASVLKKEADDYFLVTPVEKFGIKVEDAPFLITQWQWLDEQKTIMQVSTNLEDSFILNAQHPLKISDDGSLYVTVRRNLPAKVHRNVYYQWVDLAQQESTKQGTELVFFSAEHRFCLGRLSN